MRKIQIMAVITALVSIISCKEGAQNDPIAQFLLMGQGGSGTVVESGSIQVDQLYGNPDPILNSTDEIPIQIQVINSVTRLGIPAVAVNVYEIGASPKPVVLPPDSKVPIGAPPVQTKPVEAIPIGTQPDTAIPIGTQPEAAIPIGTQPEAAIPIGTQPDAAIPIGTKPELAQPVSPDSKAPIEAQPAPGTNPGSASFYGVSDPRGNVTGTITLDKATNEISVKAVYNGKSYEKTFAVVRTGNLKIGLILEGKILEKPVDTDGDGVPDKNDAYPQDPSRAFIVRYPSDSKIGYYTLAFEDHHDDDEGEDELHSREVDFNDYVVRVNGEADLNGSGKVVRVRMNALHVAGGACRDEHDDHDEDHHDGHQNAAANHHDDSDDHKGHGRSDDEHECEEHKGFRLLVNLPFGANFTLIRRDASGSTVSETPGSLAAVTGFEILQNSTVTIASMNTRSAAQFAPGMGASVEFILNAPVDQKQLSFPYDLYASYKNGKREIHLPGNVYKASGADRYLSSNGFRPALFILGRWKWPLEHVNIHDAYPGFSGWYLSGGLSNTNWFTLPIEERVYQNQ